MIKVTQKMVQAYHDAWHTTPQGAPGDRTKAGLEAVLEIIDRDYVTRYGKVSVTVPTELLGQPEIMEYARDMAIERAKIMGGTLEDIETFECEHDPFKFTDSTILTWRMRRD
jgi:hypothetical protein